MRQVSSKTAGQVLPGLLLLVMWELAAREDRTFRFLFASPLLVGMQLIQDISNGSLVQHFGVTGFESLCGLVIGSVLGSGLGLLLWLSPFTAGIARPYIAALSAVPTFALAPMTIIWFGTGVFAKVMMATLSTIFVAVVQAYEGARRTDSELIGLTRAFGASRWQSFRLVVVPATGAWIIVSCRLNVGFAILGAFVGEFISSNQGLAHYILRASGLYDVPRVLAGVISLMGLSAVLTSSIRVLEKSTAPWLRGIEE